MNFTHDRIHKHAHYTFNAIFSCAIPKDESFYRKKGFFGIVVKSETVKIVFNVKCQIADFYFPRSRVKIIIEFYCSFIITL